MYTPRVCYTGVFISMRRGTTLLFQLNESSASIVTTMTMVDPIRFFFISPLHSFDTFSYQLESTTTMT